MVNRLKSSVRNCRITSPAALTCVVGDGSSRHDLYVSAFTVATINKKSGFYIHFLTLKISSSFEVTVTS